MSYVSAIRACTNNTKLVTSNKQLRIYILLEQVGKSLKDLGFYIKLHEN